MPSSTAFHAMALVAAARTAFRASRAVEDRRAGRDPSAQEPEAPVRADLAALAEAVGGQVVRLRLRASVGVPGEPAAALVQSFEDRLLLDDLARAAGTAHQKLLSLYPAVGESLVEESRRLAAEAARLATAARYDGHLDALARRAADWRDALRDALA